ncbi:MAG: Wzz/FepE/Etk N-terminal domain-containing protein, partial [Pseudomonas sp.]
MDNSPSLYVERPIQPRVPQHQQYSEEKDTIDLLKYWRVIWRVHWKICWWVVFGCVLAMVTLSFIPSQYIGSTTLLIKEKTPPLLAFQQVTDSSAGTVDYLQTQLALLQSRDLAERA